MKAFFGFALNNFLILIILSAHISLISADSNLTSTGKKTPAVTCPISIAYIDYNNHPSEDFSWYYVKEGFEENDFEKHMICVVDGKQIKWMRLNGKDLPLKLSKSTQQIESETKDSSFYEIYSAGPYKIQMNYTATYDPSLDNKGMTYDVDIIVKKGKNEVSVKCKCLIME
ncbi:MAG TPA: hypothetical protein PLE16_09580 [Spirochaetota bacterium]|jgi:hypothetical protein|nr:hypothetical protein [Spirochaetota bacterium]HPM34834.1 hypothetical protein [Spirochaetota bacterium]HPY03466.1 hypothetical protein [Spirochaetota bacterium]HQA52834.1 hypothetical protein [Spirochaetota bacterium]